jgi:predicted metal-dependent peptidase
MYNYKTKYVQLFENWSSDGTLTPEEKQKIEEDAFQKIKLAVGWIYVKHPFYARNMSNLGVYLNWNLPYKTAATDYQNIYFDPEFVLSMDHNALRFVLIHEILHCVLLHGDTRGTRNPSLWNAAADYALNDLIVLDPLTKEGQLDFPRDIDGKMIGLWDIQYRGLSAAEIYEILKDPNKKSDNDSEKPENTGNSKSDEGNVLRDLLDDIDTSDIVQVKSSTAENPEDSDGGEKVEISEEDKKKFQQKIKQTLESSLSKNRGFLGSELTEVMLNMIKEDPNFDWKKILKRKIKNITQKPRFKAYKKRHLGVKRYVPGYERDNTRNQIKELVIAIDNSGSISVEQIKLFINEVLYLLDNFTIKNVTILYVDDEIHPELIDRFKGNEKPDYSKIKSGGGTDFHPPFKWCKENKIKPDLFIYFTDSYADYPSKTFANIGSYDKKIIWAIVNNENYLSESSKPPYGESFHVNIRDFK